MCQRMMSSSKSRLPPLSGEIKKQGSHTEEAITSRESVFNDRLNVPRLIQQQIIVHFVFNVDDNKSRYHSWSLFRLKSTSHHRYVIIVDLSNRTTLNESHRITS